MSRRSLLALSIGIGFVVAGGYHILYSLLAHLPLTLGSYVDGLDVLLVAAPYLLLSMLGVRSLLPWAVALALTLLLWAMLLHTTVSYRWHPHGSGINMGVILLIFVSPIFISAAALAVDAVQQKLFAQSRI